MRFTRRKDDTTTIRKVWDDSKTELLGVVGEIRDLCGVGLIEITAGRCHERGGL